MDALNNIVTRTKETPLGSMTITVILQSRIISLQVPSYINWLPLAPLFINTHEPLLVSISVISTYHKYPLLPRATCSNI